MPPPEPIRSPEDKRVLGEIGLRVKNLRASRGLTQMVLAEKAGLHYTYVGQVENGRRNIAVLNLYALAAALEVEISDLLPPAAPAP